MLAPFAAHVVAVELFFQIALASNLISAERKSNRTDIAYLFYLPFCNIFVSSDRLHQNCVPHFLRPNQTFVWGPDLKAGLQRLVGHYLSLPETEKEKGLVGFAPTPPAGDQDGLVGKLWDLHLKRAWRNERKIDLSPQLRAGLENWVKELSTLSGITRADAAAALSDPSFVTMNRLCRKKKGSWWQVPRDIKDETDGA